MKRTELKRRSPLRAKAPAKAEVKAFRPKKCKGCHERFTPSRQMQVACSIDCARMVASEKIARAQVEAAQDDRRKTRAQLEALKTVPQLKKEAQEAVNRYVRLRDVGKGCFVCRAPLVLGGVGGGFDAGHIRSRSNADNLRFDAERNIFGQCKPCNAPGATKDWQMREAADRLLGPEVAAELYADNKPVKWLRDDLRAIRDEARAKARQLEKA